MFIEIDDIFKNMTKWDKEESFRLREIINTIFNNSRDALSLLEYRDGKYVYLRNRRTLSVEEAILELEKNAGTQFDPDIAPLMIGHIRAENNLEYK
ncbi:MAG: hypothetical protein PHW03_04980 [Eubacteriales bacterium]|nr:hypothetical protein [Eubacteriales bacterium]MDD4390138.1 hypothetical protein [Eubacteriales bacterium]